MSIFDETKIAALQETLEKALSKNDFRTAADAFSDLSKAQGRIQALLSATHGVMEITGTMREVQRSTDPDPFDEETIFDKKAKKYITGEGYPCDVIKRAFPKFKMNISY